MRLHFQAILLLLGLSGFLPASAQKTVAVPHTHTEKGIDDPQAHVLLDKTRKWLKTAPAIEFDIEVSSPSANSPKEKARLLLSQEKYFLEYNHQEFICDGKTLWNFQKDIMEVGIYPVDPDEIHITNPLSFINHYKKSFRAKYIREEIILSQPRQLIDLLPTTSSNFHKIRIYISPDASIFQVMVYDKNENTYIYHIKSFTMMNTVDAGKFSFDPSLYEEVMINDMR